MRRVYVILAWCVIAFGALHMSVTWRLFHTASASALWFFSGGVVLVLMGALNLLNQAYGAGAPGLRWVSRATNVVVLGQSVAGGIITHASPGELVFVLGLLGVVTLLSVTVVVPQEPAQRATVGI